MSKSRSQQNWFELAANGRQGRPGKSNTSSPALKAMYDMAILINDSLLRLKRKNEEEYIQRYERDPSGFGEDSNPFSTESRISTNLISSVIDTLEAEITHIKPKAHFLTDDGTWSLQQKAKRMEQAVFSEFERNKVYQLGPKIFTDACKVGMGAVKVTNHNGHPTIERVTSGEIVVDPVEGYYDAPRTMYHVKPVSRQLLLSIYGDDKVLRDAIQKAPVAPSSYFRFLRKARSILDHILVVEGWRLPDNEDTPGWHGIALENAGLLLEEYTRERFPFAFYNWSNRTFGFYGKSVVEELANLQDELDYLNGSIEDALHWMSQGYWSVPDGLEINVEHLTENIPGRVVTTNGPGTATLQVNNPVSPQVFQERNAITERAYNQVGLTQLRATAGVPARVETGAAVREFTDAGLKRHHPKVRAYEQFFMDLTAVVVDEKNALAKAGKDKPTQIEEMRGANKKILKSISWSDISIDEPRYKIKHSPGNSLPATPVGRTRIVQEWMKGGLINRDQALQLLDIPDTEQFLSFELSGYEMALYQIEVMIEDNEFIYPDPAQDLALAFKLVNQAFLKFKLDGLPEDRLELLLDFMDAAEFELEKAEEAAIAKQLKQQQAVQAAAQAGAAPAQPQPGQPTQQEQLNRANVPQQAALLV